MKKFILAGICLLAIVLFLQVDRQQQEVKMPEVPKEEHPMSINVLRRKSYPGSEIKIESELPGGSNYKRYIASYFSEGNKIFGLLTIPDGEEKYPIIVFLHGYIPPREYKTTEKYVEYQDRLARAGMITFKIDLRGHGNSEGMPVNTHFSYDYVTDTMNAIASMKKLTEADSERVGVWGHSNGGEIGLRAMVIDGRIKAGVFWAGVVGSFRGMLQQYNSKIPFLDRRRLQSELIDQYGLPDQNPEFWQSIDPYFHLNNIGGRIQLHHGTADNSVPSETSRELKDALEKNGKSVEYFEYQGGDHNLGGKVFGPAMERTVRFFKDNL